MFLYFFIAWGLSNFFSEYILNELLFTFTWVKFNQSNSTFIFLVLFPSLPGKIMMWYPLHIDFPLFQAACIIRYWFWYRRNLATMAFGGWSFALRWVRAWWAVSISKPLGKSSSKMSGITGARKGCQCLHRIQGSPQQTSCYSGFWSQDRPPTHGKALTQPES